MRGLWGLGVQPVRSSKRAAIVVAVLVALGLAGCSATPRATGSKKPPAPTAASTTTTTMGVTSTTAPSADAAILAAYRAGWAAYEQALKTADPTDPALAATMVDPVLEQVRKNLVSYDLNGVVGTGTTTLHPHVASLTATTAVVLDCTFSRAFLVYKKTGKQVPPVTKPEYDGVKATLVLDGSTWKVKTQDVTEGTCPADY